MCIIYNNILHLPTKNKTQVIMIYIYFSTLCNLYFDCLFFFRFVFVRLLKKYTILKIHFGFFLFVLFCVLFSRQQLEFISILFIGHLTVPFPF